ncbi:hypothetical protein JCM3765_004858 [Sporobolomyces pararoseus]
MFKQRFLAFSPTILVSVVFSILVSLTVSSQTINSTSLAHTLLRNHSSNDFSSITGEQVQLRPYSLALLANKTHVQATFNVSKSYDEVGWIALGLGTSMSDSAMVILWPTSDSRSWVISHRTAGGHVKPDASTTSSTLGRWNLVPSLTTLDTQPNYTLVTIVRTLSLPKNQAIYPAARTKYANLSKSKGQNLIVAASSRRPPTDDEGSMMTMHDPGMFGMLQIDLSQKWIEPGTSSSERTEAEHGTESAGWTKFDKIIAVHAAFAMLTWLLIAPTAVLIARLGRATGIWFKWHSRIQFFATFPLTLLTMSLGLAAALTMGSASRLDLHKTFGIVMGLLLIFQLSLGQLSHLSHFTPSRSSSRPFSRVFHILVGVSILPLSWATIFFGIEEWREHSLVAPGLWLEIVYVIGIILFLLPYISSLLYLGYQRFKEGRTLYYALFGLGQTSGSPPSTTQINRGGRGGGSGRDWSRTLPVSARNSFIAGSSVVDSTPIKKRSLSTTSSTGSVEVLVEEQQEKLKGEWQK